MPRKAVKTFKAWSFSRYHDYDECPLSAKLKHLDKANADMPKGPAMARGSDIHKKAENYSLGKLRKLPEELELFDEEFKALRKIKKSVQVEQQLAVNRKWEICDWFAADAWLRVVVDAKYVSKDGKVLKVIDHKTGKIRPFHQEQLDLYAIIGFIYAPDSVKFVESELWYLDQGELHPKTYSRGEAMKLRKVWEKKTKKMLADRVFKPEPGNGCRWCDFSQKPGKLKLCKF